MQVFLETDRLVLRRFTEADVDNLFDLDSDPDVMRFINGGRPTPRDVIQNDTLPRFLHYYERFAGYGFWAAVEKATGEFLGWFHFRPPQGASPDEAELGYRLRKSAWGKGYGTEGSRALIRKGFTELGVQLVVASTMVVNVASWRVMEKAGLTLERTFHQPWPDLIDGAEQGDVEYALRKADWERQEAEAAAQRAYNYPTGAPAGHGAGRRARGGTGMAQLWAGETEKAIRNFPISGERVPTEVVRALAQIKAGAARVNAELGMLDPELARRIGAAADEVARGEHDDQFPVDIFQTGSGTSTNMNVNEVVATLAGDGVHPNDHVNMGQSSNDAFPSAVHLAALEATVSQLLPALSQLEASLAAKAAEFAELVKPGRTHLMDAVPITLGQEFAGYAAQIGQGADRVRQTLGRVGQLPLGGAAVGTGLNAHPELATRIRQRLAAATGLALSPPAHPFEAQSARDALVELSGALKVVAVSCTKIANDLRWMYSGPRAGFGEIVLPELQKGSSIMPGKVNPVMAEVLTQVAAQVIGNDAAITVGGLSGAFELNVYVPLMARNLLQSIAYLAAACREFAARCVDGITANADRMRALAESTLVTVTALNPVVGYDAAAAISREAAATGRTIREVALDHGVPADVLDKALDLRAMARGNGFAG